MTNRNLDFDNEVFMDDYSRGMTMLRFTARAFGTLAAGIGYPVAEPSIPTARVVANLDSGRVEFQINPHFIHDLKDSEIAAVIAHETYHVVLGHLGELIQTDRYKRHEILIDAQECIINDGLPGNVGFTTMAGTYRGLERHNQDFSIFTTQEGYDFILNKLQEEEQDGKGESGDDSNEKSNGEGDDSGSDSSDSDDAGDQKSSKSKSKDEDDSDADDQDTQGSSKGDQDDAEAESGADQDDQATEGSGGDDESDGDADGSNGDGDDETGQDDGDVDDENSDGAGDADGDDSDADGEGNDSGDSDGDDACNGPAVVGQAAEGMSPSEIAQAVKAILGQAVDGAIDEMNAQGVEATPEIEEMLDDLKDAGVTVSKQPNYGNPNADKSAFAVIDETSGMNVNWVELLAKINPELKQSGKPKSRDSWHQPRRRMIHSYPQVILPTRQRLDDPNKKKGDSIPTFIIALDMSGSIPERLLKDLAALAQSCPPNLIRSFPITWSDNFKVYDPERPREIVRRGGTRISSVYEYAEQVKREEGIDPYVLVITDGGFYMDDRYSSYNRGPKMDRDQIKDKWYWMAIERNDLSTIRQVTQGWVKSEDDSRITYMRDFV